MRLHRTIVAPLSVALVLTAVATTQAVPYASAVRNTTGTTHEFVLNEPADSVTIIRDGANPFTINSPVAGRHTFDMSGFSTYDIEVRKAAPVGWNLISSETNPFTNYERPTGLAVNTDPSSAYFGTVYISNNRTNDTVGGRMMGDGIYSLTADRIGVDLSNDFSVVSDPNDTSQAKAPGFTVDGSSNSPWKIVLDNAGNLIIADWSDANGGVKYAAPNLTSGGLVLDKEGDREDNPEGGGVNSSVSDEFGLIPLHGSVVSAYVTGTLGTDLTVWGIDEDLDADLELPGDDGNHIWRWDVGSTPNNYSINPTLVMDGRNRSEPYYDMVNGGVSDITYSPATDKWYRTQRRFDGSEPGLIVFSIEANGDITEEWSSLEFSDVNGLDGLEDIEGNAATEGIQDILRMMGSATISPDGSTMYVSRTQVVSDAFLNRYTGISSAHQGKVLVIPLDENGLPDIQIDDNGTPGDPTDDVLSNITSLFTAGNTVDGFAHAVRLDAAGNVYFSNNISEQLDVASPGGNTLATTSSNGTFSVEELILGGLDGDFNDDGIVDAIDYAVWRENLGAPDGTLQNDGELTGNVGTDHYNLWRSNYGSTTSPSAATNAPEPSSIVAMWMIACGVLLKSRNER